MTVVPWKAHGNEGVVSIAVSKDTGAMAASQAVMIPMPRLTAIMQNIHYAKEGFSSLKDEHPVFDGDQIRALSPKIHRALKRLHDNERVNYRIDRLKGQVFFSQGALYWHFEKINNRRARSVYRFNENTAVLDDETESQTNNSIEEYYWQLVPQSSQSLFRKRPDWIITPVDMEPGHHNAQVVRKQQGHKTARPPAHEEGDTWSRITRIHQLLTQDLINREEYDTKIAALISEYEATHPSIDNRLKFLRSLRDNKYISDDAYAHGKKRLLDAF